MAMFGAVVVRPSRRDAADRDRVVGQPVTTADGTVHDANTGQPIAGGVGAGGIRPQDVQGAALNTPARLEPCILSGAVTPAEHKRGNASSTRSGRSRMRSRLRPRTAFLPATSHPSWAKPPRRLSTSASTFQDRGSARFRTSSRRRAVLRLVQCGQAQRAERQLAANGGQLPPTWEANYNEVHGAAARLAPIPSSGQAVTLGWTTGSVPADVSNLNGFGIAPAKGAAPVGTVATGANGAQTIMTMLGWRSYVPGRGVID